MDKNVQYISEARAKIYPNETRFCSSVQKQYFSPYDIRQYDDMLNSEKSSIMFWCHNPEGESCAVYVKEFPCFVRLVLPECDIHNERLYWDEELIHKFIIEINRYLNTSFFSGKSPYSLSGPKSYTLTTEKPLYNFDAKEVRILTLRFDNKQSADLFKKFYPYYKKIIPTKDKDGKVKTREQYLSDVQKEEDRMIKKIRKFNNTEIIFKGIEDNVDDIRRLMSFVNLKYSQWFSANCKQIYDEHPDKISTGKEYWIDWKSICPVDENESINWVVNPLLMVMDLETYSHNPKKFPNAQHPKDCIYMNSIVIGREGEEPTKICLTTADSEPTDKGKVILLKSEADLICKTYELIKELNPDLIGGYNTYRFDFPYLLERAEDILGLKDYPRYKLASRCGRIKGKAFTKYHKIWKSSGYGNNQITYPEMDGRVLFDLLPNIKKQYKLKVYKLDYVANYFLGVGKNDMTAKEMFRTYDAVKQKKKGGLKRMKRVIEYCIVDSLRPYQIFNKIGLWRDWKELSNVAGVNVIDLFTRGEQIRCFSQICDKLYKEGYFIPEMLLFDGKYKGATVQEPIRGYHKNLITLDFASLYPSIMRAFNLSYDTFVPKEEWHKYRDEDVFIIKFTQEEPEHGDFEEEKDEESDSEDEEGNTKKKKAKKEVKMINVHYEYRFVKHHIRQGIIPTIETKCCDDRNKVKKQMKVVGEELTNYEDEIKRLDPSCDRYQEIYNLLPDLRIKYEILNKRQNAIKVLANSLYGFLGAIAMGKLPHLPSALSITAMGRALIAKANDFIREHHKGVVIYGDTDSGMYKVPNIDNRKLCYDLGVIIEKQLKEHKVFLDPISMEFEKAADMLILKKKNYYMMMFNKDGTPQTKNGKIKLDAKGVATARRDKAPFLTDLYQKIVDIIMIKGNDVDMQTHIFDSINCIFDSIIDLLLGDIDTTKLVLVKELNQLETGPMAQLYRYMKDNGREPQQGERLEYIIVDVGFKGAKTGERMREYDMWIENFDREDYDVTYYVGCLIKSIDYLFNTGYLPFLETFSKIGYKPYSKRKNGKKERTMDKGLVNMIYEILLDVMYLDKLDIERHFRMSFDDLSRKEYTVVILEEYKKYIFETLREEFCMF